MSEYKWIAQDEDGTVEKYAEHPNPVETVCGGWWSSDYTENPTRIRVQENLKRKIINWRDTLINLETHDYKIEDGILMKVELQRGDKDVNAMKSYLQSRNKHPEVILKGSELQYKDKHGKWNNCSYDEYRIKPKTVKFRNYLNNTGKVKTATIESTEMQTFFVRWIGEWQEVEIEE